MNWSKHCDRVSKGKPGFPIVEVVWDDAVAFALDWEDEVHAELRRTTTVGYLVHETDLAITLVSVINSEHVAHGIIIPKPVLSRRTL